MSLFENLSDDQIAILGSCGAMLASFAFLMVTHHFGQTRRREEAEHAYRPHTLPAPSLLVSPERTRDSRAA